MNTAYEVIPRAPTLYVYMQKCQILLLYMTCCVLANSVDLKNPIDLDLHCLSLNM